LKPYGVAILGTGNVAKGHLMAIQATEGAELVALGTRVRERGKAWAVEQGVSCPIYSDLESLLADEQVDIVIICTPNNQHAQQTIQVARAGKHILIEKPVALNLQDLRAMQAAVQESGVRTLVSFVLHWNPALNIAKRLVAKGIIGDVFLAETCYWHSTPRAVPGHWMTTKEVAGSVFLMGGCHAVDAARWLVGADIVEVCAFSDNKGKEWYEYPHTVSAAIKFANNAVGRISTSMGCTMPYTFEVTLMGTRGTIRDNRLYADLLDGQDDYAVIPTQLPDSGSVLHHPFTPGLEHFVACLRADKDTEQNLNNAVNVHEVCLAVDMSVEQRQPVSLPLLD
jgi:predicted dehydrogenase